jgi:DNA replication protein DnaC
MESQIDERVSESGAAPGPIKRECATHGSYQAMHIFGRHWANCPECERQAQERIAAQDAERAREQRAAVAKARLECNLRNCGLAGRNLRASFQNFTATTPKQREVLDAVVGFAKTFTTTSGGGLWLLGLPGTGKTHLGAALVSNSIRERSLAACMHSFGQIQTMLRARWSNSKESRSFWEIEDGLETTDQLLEHLGTVPLLVLDELGVGRGTDAELETLFQIVDRRYQLERPTVMLSNLKPIELKAAMGDRAYDRLREGTRLLICDWPSHRGQIK